MTLENSSELVDASASQCAVPADKARELGIIGLENIAELNRIVSGALAAGSLQVDPAKSMIEIDCFVCGEVGPLKALPHGSVRNALLVASASGFLAPLEYLLTRSVDKRLLNEALGMGINHGSIEVVELLIRNGASLLTAAELLGSTPLFLAANRGSIGVLRYLVERHGADVNQPNPTDGATPLFVASEMGFVATVKYLVGHNAVVDQAKWNGSTPLTVASEYGRQEVVDFLLSKKANSNNTKEDGSTPLLIAVQNGHSQVAESLLKHGANANYMARTGQTPLITAIAGGHLETVKTLLRFGANSTLRSPLVGSPREVAQALGRFDILCLL